MCEQERARRRAEEREHAQAEQRALMLAANQQQQRLKVHLMHRPSEIMLPAWQCIAGRRVDL